MTGVDAVLDGRPWRVALGNCLDVLQWLPDNSVDSIVTDPPYGLSFMGKRWDYDVPSVEIWREVLRVLKPGGHLLAFFGTRTYHRGVVRIEDAGFEIRDMIEWFYGQGMAKSMKPRENSLGTYRGASREKWRVFWRRTGLGTGMSPSHEPIVLARKPFPGTTAATVLEWGTGAINVDGCRVGTTGARNNGRKASSEYDQSAQKYGDFGATEREDYGKGRWPPNITLSHSADCGLECVGWCPVRILGEQSGETTSGSRAAGEHGLMGYQGADAAQMPAVEGSTGTAARFFPKFRYIAKPSRAEKDAGITREPMTGGEATGRKNGSAALDCPRTGAGRAGGARNPHPTVKPIGLMRWLCRLITPPGGVIVDPFNGSGTTGCAAVLEGFRYIGIDMEAENVEVSDERIAFWEKADPNYETVPKPEPKDERQRGLFE